MKRISELDGLRAVAILCVVANHMAQVGLWVGAGFLGVDIFFVLSGFLITTLLSAEEERSGGISLPAFYIRRARRILPALFAAVALALALGATPQAALAALTFLGNILDGGTMGILSHTWSLAVEEHFYIALPLIFFLPLRFRVGVLIAIVACAIASRAYFASLHSTMAYTFTLCRADSLAIGCLCALRLDQFRASPWISQACVAAVIWFIVYGDPDFMRGFPATVFAAVVAITIAGIVSGALPWLRPILNASPMQYIGSRSYGIYLYHLPIFDCLSGLPHWSWVLKITLTLLIAEISYRTIEAFFRRPSLAAINSPYSAERTTA